jgi:hypothetical protein
MGSIWDLGLGGGRPPNGQGPKASQRRHGLRSYGGACLALAFVIAAVLIMASVSGPYGTSSAALLAASMMGPVILAAAGIILIRMAGKQ